MLPLFLLFLLLPLSLVNAARKPENEQLNPAILVYRTGKYYLSKPNLKYIHALLHLIAFICAVIGLHAAFNSHVKGQRENLYSLHSWIGLITVIIFAAQLLCGFFTYLLPLFENDVKTLLMQYHVFYGTLAFLMALITAISGVTEMAARIPNYSSLPSVAYLINIMGLAVVMYGVLTLYLLLKPEYKAFPMAEN